MPSWARQKFENHGFSIAKGEVPGYSAVLKNGVNFDIDIGVPETIWTGGGLYPWSALDTPQTIYVLSTSASDTGSVIIEGLDENWDKIEEEVDFDGATAGSSTNTFRRINEMTYDNGVEENVGEITARTGSAVGSVVAHIDEGFSQTSQLVYTVPAGFTGFILHQDHGVQKGEDAQFRSFVREGGVGRFRIGHIAEVYQSTYEIHFPIYPTFPEKTDLDFRVALVETNNTRAFSNLCLALVETNKLRR